jgi:metal transporter CNNM
MRLSPDHIFAICMVIVCVVCAGLAAGLTIGLVSIDKNELNLTLINGSPEEKRQARAILPIIKDHHWLLVTLFLFNAAANETLPLFLGDLVPRFMSVIIATFTVLIFGEILPSSVFSGPSQMKIAAELSGVVYVLLILFYPVARPIGLFLDFWLGKHDLTNQAPFNAKDLYTLLSMARVETPRAAPEDGALGFAEDGAFGDGQQFTPLYGALSRNHSRTSSRAGSFHSDLDNMGESLESLGEHQAPLLLRSTDANDANLLEHDVVTIAQGAIVCSKIFVEEITQDSFYSVQADRVVCLEFLEEVGRCGHSRIPVKHGDAILGYLLAKELLCKITYYVQRSLNASKAKNVGEKSLLVRELHIHPMQYCTPTMTVLNALNVLQRGTSRVGVVTSDGTAFGEVKGYFTLEDVMENIIQEEIDDETDNTRKMKARMASYHISDVL